jgi:hypothetical protein
MQHSVNSSNKIINAEDFVKMLLTLLAYSQHPNSHEVVSEKMYNYTTAIRKQTAYNINF